MVSVSFALRLSLALFRHVVGRLLLLVLQRRRRLQWSGRSLALAARAAERNVLLTHVRTFKPHLLMKERVARPLPLQTERLFRLNSLAATPCGLTNCTPYRGCSSFGPFLNDRVF